MPYDERVETLLAQLKGAREAYHSALRLAVEQVRGYLAACREGSNGLAVRAASELGELGRGRIEPGKFATVFLAKSTPPASSVRAVDGALRILEDLESRSDELFVFTVETGEDLRTVIEDAFAQAGRAFGAARIVNLVRTGRYEPERHDRLLERFPFRSWNRAERRLAPPLVIEIAGEDLYASSLGDYLDGTVKLFLLVREPAAPAPLARLITPGTLVMQTTSVTDLSAAVETVRPAVAAVLPEGSATFLHDPSAGKHVWERLEISHRPERKPRRAVGGISASQQSEELELLDLLSERAPTPVTVTGADQTSVETPHATPIDPVDRLAAWLLEQTQ